MSARFYRRPLPETSIPFASPAGRALFREALDAGGAEGYFAVSSQFSTQAEPTFCGLTTLVVCLNALAVDPGRQWKGVWRWFSEEQLSCCVPLEAVRAGGISLDTFACLARCQGAHAEVYRPPPPPPPADAGATTVPSSASGTGGGATGGERVCGDLAAFRSLVRGATSAPDGCVLAVAYSRRVLRQSGDGHFSPVGAYAPASDAVLILDVARFKYPPHWVPLAHLWEAMHAPDPDTGKPRGCVLLRRNVSGPLLLFHLRGFGLPAAAALPYTGGEPAAANTCGGSGSTGGAAAVSACCSGAVSSSSSGAGAVAACSGSAPATAVAAGVCAASLHAGLMATFLAQLNAALVACEATCGKGVDASGGGVGGAPAASAAGSPCSCCCADAGASAQAPSDATVVAAVRCFVRCYLAVASVHGHLVTPSQGVPPAGDSAEYPPLVAGMPAPPTGVAGLLPSVEAAPSPLLMSAEQAADVALLTAAIEAVRLHALVVAALTSAEADNAVMWDGGCVDTAGTPTVAAPTAVASSTSVRLSHIIVMLMLVWASTEKTAAADGGGVALASPAAAPPLACRARSSLLAAALDDLASSVATGSGPVDGASGKNEESLPPVRARALLSTEVTLLGEQLRFLSHWCGA